MKQGWEIKKLRDISEYFNGLTYTPKDVSDDGVIVLRSSNIQNENLDFSDIVRVNAKVKDKLFVNEGDILMCSRNGSKHLVGKTAPILDIKEHMTFGTFMMIIRSEYNPYLLWFFKTDDFKRQISGGENTMINQVTRYMLDEITLPFPPANEQERIVGIVDSAFAKIEALRANAQQNLQNTKDLFQASLKQELTPKQGWFHKSINDVCDFYNGKAHENDIDENGEYILVNSKYISSDRGVVKRTNKQLFPLYQNDIVMVMSDVPNGKAIAKCLLIDADNQYSLNQRICAFRNSTINVELLRYLINRNSYLLSFDNGENQTNLRKDDILKCPISCPDDTQEQQSIVEKLDALSERCRAMEENYRQTIAHCNDLKQALLTKAFNGEL